MGSMILILVYILLLVNENVENNGVFMMMIWVKIRKSFLVSVAGGGAATDFFSFVIQNSDGFEIYQASKYTAQALRLVK